MIWFMITFNGFVEWWWCFHERMICFANDAERICFANDADLNVLGFKDHDIFMGLRLQDKVCNWLGVIKKSFWLWIRIVDDNSGTMIEVVRYEMMNKMGLCNNKSRRSKYCKKCEMRKTIKRIMELTFVV